MVALLTFSSDKPSSNPPEVYSFYSAKFASKNENYRNGPGKTQLKTLKIQENNFNYNYPFHFRSWKAMARQNVQDAAPWLFR